MTGWYNIGMFGIKSNKLEEWFASLPASTRKKLEDSTPDQWNAVLAGVLTEKLTSKDEQPAPDSRKTAGDDEATILAKKLGVMSLAILQRELKIDEAEAKGIMADLEQKGIVEHGEAQAIRKVFNPSDELEIDDAVVADIVAHLLEHQTISAEILKNKFAVSEVVIPIVLDALEESGFISE